MVTRPDTTTVVYPGHCSTIDDSGNLVVACGGWARGLTDRR